MKRTPEQIAAHLRGRPWAQTLAGNAVPLVGTEPLDIDWTDIIFGLSYSTRYAGHARGYTIAQHSVLAAQVAAGANVHPDAEMYALLHDAHEAYIGDITTPAQDAIIAHANVFHEGMGDVVADGIRELKGTLDKAIFTAAGLAYPMPPAVAELVKDIDLRLLKTEVRDIMGGERCPWQIDAEPYPWHIRTLWDSNNAMFSFERALTRLLRLTASRMSIMSSVDDLQTTTHN